MGHRREPRAVRHVVGAGIVTGRRFLAACALALVAGVVCAMRPPSGACAAPAFPPSVPLRTTSGASVCHVTPMANGAYGVAHCIHAVGRLFPDGIPAAYSVDPVRDLSHFAALADPGVRLRDAVDGEVLHWQNSRAFGSVMVTAHGWQIADGHGFYDYSRVPCAGERVILTAWRDGSRFMPGDSGSGAWGEDGALIGVLASACTVPGCEVPQPAAFVPVP